jgi:hypothetical protein
MVHAAPAGGTEASAGFVAPGASGPSGPGAEAVALDPDGVPAPPEGAATSPISPVQAGAAAATITTSAHVRFGHPRIFMKIAFRDRHLRASEQSV